MEKYKIPTPLPEPRELGKDRLGRDLGSYTPKEYKLWKEQGDRKEVKLRILKGESTNFRVKVREGTKVEEREIEEERRRRSEIGQLRGKGTNFCVSN